MMEMIYLLHKFLRECVQKESEPKESVLGIDVMDFMGPCSSLVSHEVPHYSDISDVEFEEENVVKESKYQ